MTILLFLGFIVHSQQTYVCRCGNLDEQSICDQSKSCVWRLGKCRQADIVVDSTGSNNCSQYPLEECRLQANCGFHLGACIPYSSCLIFLKDYCNLSSQYCVSDGKKCIQRKTCAEYELKKVCANRDINGVYCYWDQNSSPRCKPASTCDELPKFILSDSECLKESPKCMFNMRGGCLDRFSSCEEHNELQCKITLDGKECIWNEQLEKCLDYKCENIFLTYDELCRANSLNCTTNGVTCITRKSCEDANKAGCSFDDKNNPCVYYDGKCRIKICDNAPAYYYTYSLCQEFDAQCVPRRNGGCKNQPQSCKDFETQDSCLFQNKCFWTGSNCKIVECSDAPNNFSNSQCKSFLSHVKCIKAQTSCMQLPSNCSQFKSQEACEKEQDGEGNDCYFYSLSCFRLDCQFFKAPAYNSHEQCQARSKKCTFSILKQSCDYFICENVIEKDLCITDKNGSPCRYEQKCLEKNCAYASSLLQSHDECEQYLNSCTVSNYSGQARGCQLKLPICKMYASNQCFRSFDGTPCFWDSINSLCKEASLCEQAPKSITDVYKCLYWNNNGTKCFLDKSQAGCREYPAECQDFVTQSECNNFQPESADTCIWTSTGCEIKQCHHAPPYFTTNLECRRWMSSCVVDYDLNGCRPENTAETCADLKFLGSVNHFECQAWNPSCTKGQVSTQCASKTQCEYYLSSNQCKTSLQGALCFWDGTRCITAICSLLTPASQTHDACESISKECTVNSYFVTCSPLLSECSLYQLPYECKRTTDNTICNWDVNGYCRRQRCEQNKSALYAYQCINYNHPYECQLRIMESGRYGIGCETRPLTCGEVTSEIVCNQTVVSQDIRCYWVEKCQVASQIACVLINRRAKVDSDCYKYNRQCSLNRVTMRGCAPISQCSNSNSQYCDGLKLTINQSQCLRNRKTCESNQSCQNLSSRFCQSIPNQVGQNCSISTDFVIANGTGFWNQTCISYGRISGYDSGTISDCPALNQAQCESLVVGDQLYCLWSNWQCVTRNCEHQTTATGLFADEICYSYKSQCISRQSVYGTGAGCVNFSICEHVKSYNVCVQFNRCQWQGNSCVTQLVCASHPGQTEVDCLSFNYLCRLNPSASSGCVYVTCDRANREEDCIQIYSQGCSWSNQISKCIVNAPVQPIICNSYSLQSNCDGFAQCIWDGTMCVEFHSCSQVDAYGQGNCSRKENSCYINYNVRSSQCIYKKLSCSEYQFPYQCYSTIDNLLCIWQNNQCIDFSCSQYSGTVTSSNCRSFSKACEANDTSTSCIPLLSQCSEYTQNNCDGAKTSLGKKCYYSGTCIERTCANSIYIDWYNCSQWLETCTYNDSPYSCIEYRNVCTYPSKMSCEGIKTTVQTTCTWNKTSSSCETRGCSNFRKELFVRTFDNFSNNSNDQYCYYNPTTSGYENPKLNCSDYETAIKCNYAKTLNGVWCVWYSNTCVGRTCNNFPTSLETPEPTKCQQWNYCNYFNSNCVDYTCANTYFDQNSCNDNRLPFNGQYCVWNGSSCVAKPCTSINADSCPTIFCASYATSCQDQRSNCTDYTNQEDCSKNYKSNKKKCFWFSSSNQCISSSTCAGYTEPASTQICKEWNDCVYDGSVCIDRQATCSEYINQISCDSSQIISGLYCKWVNNQCTNYYCYDHRKAKYHDECKKWLPSCTTNPDDSTEQPYSKCVTILSCSQAPQQITSHSDCQNFFSTCTAGGLEPQCSSLPQDCHQASQEQCDKSILEPQCFWNGSECRRLSSCADIGNYGNSHEKCNALLPYCTVNSSLNGCINLAPCASYTIQQSCEIDLNGNLCVWINAACVIKTCQTASLSVINSTYCSLYFTPLSGHCVINSEGTGCDDAKSDCSQYNEIQCKSLGIRDRAQQLCIWRDGTGCVRPSCQFAPPSPLINEECQAFSENCYLIRCRELKCEEFIRSDDFSCGLVFPNYQCTTNGFYCVPRASCNQALVKEACTFSSNGESCQWNFIEEVCTLKSCATAPLTFNTESECNLYFHGCTARLGGGCVQKTTCEAAQLETSCTIDAAGDLCLWDEDTKSCQLPLCLAQCGDGIITPGQEECDDGNNLPYDGCYKCQFHCVYGCQECQQGVCAGCLAELGFYLESEECVSKCGDGITQGQELCDDGNNLPFDGCFLCNYQCSENCIECFQGTCYECPFGYYAQKGQCQSRCGDGIRISEVEECDNGNDAGCLNCKIMANWLCFENSNKYSDCVYSLRPKLIALVVSKSNKDRVQEIEIISDQPLKYLSAAYAIRKLEDFIKVEIKNLNPDSYILQTNMVSTLFYEQLQPLEISITITFLSQTFQPPILQATLIDVFENKYSQHFEKLSYSQTLPTPFFLENVQSERALSAAQFTEVVIYMLASVASISVISGSMEIFWNLIDLLQQLSLIQFLNIQFPENLNVYLEVFGLITIQPLVNYLRFDQIMQFAHFGQAIPFIPTSNKFQAADLNAYFLLNSQSFFLVILLSYGAVGICTLVFAQIDVPHLAQVLDRSVKGQIVRVYGMKLLRSIQSNLIKLQTGFYYSGQVRIFLSGAYDLIFAIQLQLAYYDSRYVLNNGFTFACGITVLGLNSVLFVLLARPQMHRRFSVLYEGLSKKEKIWVREYHAIYLVKKICYIYALVYLQSSPQLQSIALIFNSSAFIVYCIIAKPLVNKTEQGKVIMQEAIICLTYTSFLLYFVDLKLVFSFLTEEEQQIYLGWLNIVLISSLLVYCLVVDFLTQIKHTISSQLGIFINKKFQAVLSQKVEFSL